MNGKKQKLSKEILLRGSSLFKPLPKPKNCPSLGIPLGFCLCQREFIPRSDPILAENIANFAVDWLNNYIDLNNASNKCALLSLKSETVKLEEYEPNYQVDYYQITFEVEPSGGQFSGLVAKDFNPLENNTMEFSLISEHVLRLNSYKGQSNCVKNNRDITPICYCNNLLKNKNKQ